MDELSGKGTRKQGFQAATAPFKISDQPLN
jgi:hypothetical protein